MEESEFWKIIDLATQKSTKSNEIIDFLVDELVQFSETEMMDFETILAQKLFQLDNQNLASSVYGDEPVSADDFLYVRCWIITQGKDFYEHIFSTNLDIEFETSEGLLYAVKMAFEKKHPTKEYSPDPKMMLSRETYSNAEGWGKEQSFLDEILTSL